MQRLDLERHEVEILAEMINKASFQGNIIEPIFILKQKISHLLNAGNAAQKPTLVPPQDADLEA